MAKTVFSPGEAKVENAKILLPLVHNFEPQQEEMQEIVEEYHGPTADDLRKEAELFKSSWEAEKQMMINEAQTNADQIIKRAEDTAFSEVKRQTDAAAEIKADAENQANEIIQKAKDEAAKIIADAETEKERLGEDNGERSIYFYSDR